MANDFYACVHVYNEWDRKVAFSLLFFFVPLYLKYLNVYAKRIAYHCN